MTDIQNQDSIKQLSEIINQFKLGVSISKYLLRSQPLPRVIGRMAEDKTLLYFDPATASLA